MGRRKKSSENAVNLFSFQDVLACLTGVLIMVSLLLCIDGLSSNINMAKGAQAAGQPMDMTAQVERLTQEVAVLRKAVEDRKGGVDVSKQVVDVLDDRVKQVAEEAEKAKRRDDALAAELAARNKELAKLREEEAAAKDAATAATRLRWPRRLPRCALPSPLSLRSRYPRRTRPRPCALSPSSSAARRSAGTRATSGAACACSRRSSRTWTFR